MSITILATVPPSPYNSNADSVKLLTRAYAWCNLEPAQPCNSVAHVSLTLTVTSAYRVLTKCWAHHFRCNVLVTWGTKEGVFCSRLMGDLQKWMNAKFVTEVSLTYTIPPSCQKPPAVEVSWRWLDLYLHNLQTACSKVFRILSLPTPSKKFK
jgi:hypothetical protein